MTIIRPNSISGVSSITAQGGDINLYRADGTKADIPIVNNIIAGVITATTGTFTGNLGVGGVLTYEDVTNIDSIGIITARSTVSIADSIIHTGDTNTSLRFPANNAISAETNGLERLRIDFGGRFLVGTSSYKSNLNASSDVQIGQFVGKADNECACLSVFSYPGTTNPTARGAKLQLHRARSSDGTTNTAVAENDLIGSVEFKGNDGTSFTAAARIDASVDGAPGTDDMPGRLVFSTSADGSGAPTEQMRISKEGYITKPNHPSFCARHQDGSGFSGNVVVLTRISTSWDVWNTGGHYSTSTGKFTVPVTGVYYFEGQLMTTGHSNGDNIQDMFGIMSNNGRITYVRQRESYFTTVTNANGYYTNSCGSAARLSAGDTVWLERHSSQSWGYSNRYYSYFTGWVIG